MTVPSAPSRAPLQALVAAAEGVVPGMRGSIGSPVSGQIAAGADNQVLLQGLVDAVSGRTPEAGRGYWALRSWNMLVWQPAVLALLAVHRFGFVPALNAMSQDVVGDTVVGYRLPEDGVAYGEPAALVPVAARELRELADGLLDDLGRVVTVKPALAHRLLADRVLATLLRLHPDTPPAEVRGFADDWLAGLDLREASGLMAVPLEGGGEQLALERRACCLEYRVVGADYCASCPKQTIETRHHRLRESWKNDVRAI